VVNKRVAAERARDVVVWLAFLGASAAVVNGMFDL
jgi:TRAP-type C4-dicarboxylate transport system permease small subunit